ncbi:hypothetical protein GJ496_008245 [Pomphorhynchus laevis]|nr:hypothetical protein GJ496_008245 [Pomphorhynchus laevis]
MNKTKYDVLAKHICLQSYLDKHGLKAQFGVLKPAENESVNDYKMVNTMAASDIEKSSFQIEEECNHCYETINKREIRKKSVYMNMAHEVYCLGGYIFDPLDKVRSIPEQDWKLDLRTKALTPISPVPDGRVNFGCTALAGNIYVIGGQSFNNVPYSSVLKYDTYSNEWTRLPNMPASQSWPGVAVEEQGRLIVVGGYSVLVGEPRISSECYMFTPGQTTWKRLPNLPIGACNVMTILEDKIIYAMGGRTVKDGKTESVPSVFKLKEGAEKWETVTEIPDYDIRTKGLLFEGGVLSLIDRIIDKRTGELKDSKPIKYYKIEEGKWYDGEYTRVSPDKEDNQDGDDAVEQQLDDKDQRKINKEPRKVDDKDQRKTNRAPRKVNKEDHKIPKKKRTK